jgi:DNA-binding NarL/FixJ family response regulator
MLSKEIMLSVRQAEEVLGKYTTAIKESEEPTSPILQYFFFNSFSKSLKYDDRDRAIGINQHVLNYRRKAVVKLYNDGESFDAIARKLKIPEMTVRNDINWYNENRRKKKF